MVREDQASGRPADAVFADRKAIPLAGEEINILASVSHYDWSNVEPSIFGTLFERHFDPDKEVLVGAHYTSREDIAALVEPGGKHGQPKLARQYR